MACAFEVIGTSIMQLGKLYQWKDFPKTVSWNHPILGWGLRGPFTLSGKSFDHLNEVGSSRRGSLSLVLYASAMKHSFKLVRTYVSQENL